MATTIDVTQAQYYIPEIWSRVGLEVLRGTVVMPNLVVKDSDVASFNVGDILHIPYPGTFSANSKTAGNGVTLQAPSGETEVQVTLDTHKEVTFVIEDIAKVFASYDLQREYVTSAIAPLADALEASLLGLYSGLSQLVGSAGVDLTFDTFLTGRKTLNDAKVPKTQRYAVISTKDAKSMLSDPDLRRYFDVSNIQGITEGAIGRIAGFDIFEHEGTISSGGTMYNLAFNRGAFILATRALPAVGPGAVSSVMVDPVSGLAMRAIMSYDTDLLGTKVTLDMLWGVAELRDAKAVVLRG